jgi:hypothetical protein
MVYHDGEGAGHGEEEDAGRLEDDGVVEVEAEGCRGDLEVVRRVPVGKLTEN